MVDVVQDQYDLYPTFHFDTADEIRANTLSAELEMLLKKRIYEMTDVIMNTDIIGDALEVAQIVQQQNFLKGKIAAFRELLDDSKVARMKIIEDQNQQNNY